MSADDQVKPPSSPLAGGEDDLIELTEVVEETPTEVVLDFRPDKDDLDSLKSPPPPSPEEKPEASPPEAEESLNDFLASLPDLPEDLDLPAPEPPPEIRTPDRDLGQELAERLDEAELKDLVRQVVQETVERLAREILPEMAAVAIEREFSLLKKRLAETD